MKFLDTVFGDKRGSDYFFVIDVENKNLTSLEGCPDKATSVFTCSFNNLVDLKGRPKKIGVNFSCKNNKLISLEGAPKEIKNIFNCTNNPKLKNIKEQIIKYGIAAKSYVTDEGIFSFEDIKEEFNEHYKELRKKKREQKLQKFEIAKKDKKRKKEIKNNFKKFKNNDYGLSI